MHMVKHLFGHVLWYTAKTEGGHGENKVRLKTVVDLWLNNNVL